MSQLPATIIPAPVQEWVDRIGGPRRAGLLAAGLGMSLLIFAMARWAAAPSWVPLYSGMPLETTAQVTTQLSEAGIGYQLELGGTEVLVSASDLARARVVLASAGLPSAGRPGLELFDQPSWGMTDFTQRINYRRALEGELERTISQMSGVESAKVHLAMYETSSIRRIDRPAEASVVVQLRSGGRPPADVVQGIAHLVASSVDGLSSEKVTVLDGAGRLLSIPDDGGTTALNSRQLAIQRETESYLEAKAEEIVAGIVGPGNVRIQVAADVNFDRIERTVQSLDPDNQMVMAEERSEIIPGPEGGAGSTNQVATYDATRSLEVFSGATGTVRRLSVAVLVNDRVVVDGEDVTYTPRSDAELARIESLVRTAVGVDSSRGDEISVVSVPFDGVSSLAAESTGIDWLELIAMYQRPAITVLGLLLAFFVALRVVRLARVEPDEDAVPIAGEPAIAAVGAEGGIAELESQPALEPSPPEPLLPANSAIRERVAANVTDYPDLAARLVRAWLRGG